MLKPDVEAAYTGITALELSSNTKKAVVTILNEIVLSWIRKYETQIIPGSKKFNKNMPKILTSIFCEQILPRLPAIGLMLAKYNLMDFFLQNAKTDFLRG
jgi:hypothetical protein